MRILFTVTNQLNYDQRMIRICNSLVGAGYDVELIGVRFLKEANIKKQSFKQKKLRVFAKKGFAFYAEYNIRLFFYLLLKRAGAICSIDLDTIMPVYLVSVLRGIKRIHDAHEYFSQMKEVITRKNVYRFWHRVEQTFLSRFPHGYTVSTGIAQEYKRHYQVNYEVIRNVPLFTKAIDQLAEAAQEPEPERIIIYQGSVNHARGFEYLIPAMKLVKGTLHIYGDGNFMNEALRLYEKHQLNQKIIFKGKATPEELRQITLWACVGVNLVEPEGLSQIYSLANKFFDYIHAGIPQITMNFPEYKAINDRYKIALLLDDLSVESIAAAINRLLNDRQLRNSLSLNCQKARKDLNWQKEEKKLIAFYDKLLR